MTDPEDPRLRLAYDEGLRSLAVQREDFANIRTRAVTLASVASLAAGLLGGFLPDHASLDTAWVYGALVAFLVLIASVCVILLPWKVIFENDPRTILSGYYDAGVTPSQSLYWLAHYAGENAAANARVLVRLVWAYVVGVLAVAAVVACLLLALASGLRSL